MAGIVSYELLNSKTNTNGTWFTAEGGVYATYINNTGSASVKGTIVVASTALDNAVEIASASSQMPIGVVYETGVANGDPVKVVIYGRAEVLLRDGESASQGYWCGTSIVSGRMYQLSAPPLLTDYYREIGHSLETTASGTDVLSMVTLHFN